MSSVISPDARASKMGSARLAKAQAPLYEPARDAEPLGDGVDVIALVEAVLECAAFVRERHCQMVEILRKRGFRERAVVAG
jgi:hypothetical protein